MQANEDQDKMPLFGSVKKAYLFVIGFMLLQVAVYYLLTRILS